MCWLSRSWKELHHFAQFRDESSVPHELWVQLLPQAFYYYLFSGERHNISGDGDSVNVFTRLAFKVS
jgi:hypothetical protein